MNEGIFYDFTIRNINVATAALSFSSNLATQLVAGESGATFTFSFASFPITRAISSTSKRDMLIIKYPVDVIISTAA